MHLKHPIKRRLVGKIPFNKLAAQHRIAEAAREVIEGDHMMPFIQQHLHHVRADIACTANDQYFHSLTP